MTDMDMMELMERFHTDDACRDVLEKLRWPDGVTCPRCKGKSIRNSYTRNQFDCGSCGYQFSALSGTIFHDSHLPLKKWFVAIYLMVESKKGISANQMKRTLKVSYKTAWYLCHRIRAAMCEAQPQLLSGVVEADETFVGGKRTHVGHGYRADKVIVAGVVQREGDIRLHTIPDTTRKTLHEFIRKHTAPDTEAIYTDEWPAYKGIADQDTRHETVNHSKEEWVRGDVHTNGMENVWSLLDRSIIGAFHHVSEKHFDKYLDELEWRFNNRDNDFLFRDTLLKLIASENLPYQELVH